MAFREFIDYTLPLSWTEEADLSWCCEEAIYSDSEQVNIPHTSLVLKETTCANISSTLSIAISSLFCATFNKRGRVGVGPPSRRSPVSYVAMTTSPHSDARSEEGRRGGREQGRQMLLRSRSRTPHRGHGEEREDQETPRNTMVKEDGRKGHPARREEAGATWEGEDHRN